MEDKKIIKCPDGKLRRVSSCNYSSNNCINCLFKKSGRINPLHKKYGKRPKKEVRIINQNDLVYLENLKRFDKSEILDVLIYHVKHGANLSTIEKALISIGERIDEKHGHFTVYGGKGSDYFRVERKVKHAMRLLQKLEPVMVDFTEGQSINAWIKESTEKLNQYLELLLIQECKQLWMGIIKEPSDLALGIFKTLYPSKILRGFLKQEPIKQSKHYYFDFAIKTLVEEFKRIYGTDNTAYKETAKLLNLFLPSVFKSSHKHIAKRYNLLKNKGN